MQKNQELLNVQVKNYLLLYPIGLGQFTQVIKAKNTDTGDEVAMKLFS